MTRFQRDHIREERPHCSSSSSSLFPPFPPFPPLNVPGQPCTFKPCVVTSATRPDSIAFRNPLLFLGSYLTARDRCSLHERCTSAFSPWGSPWVSRLIYIFLVITFAFLCTSRLSLSITLALNLYSFLVISLFLFARDWIVFSIFHLSNWVNHVSWTVINAMFHVTFDAYFALSIRFQCSNFSFLSHPVTWWWIETRFPFHYPCANVMA